MTVPADRKYTETHEWFLKDGEFVVMGITQFAAEELTDITYVELPEIGASFAEGDKIGEVESVKATSEIFTAVAGNVTEINESLVDHPELINDDAFEDGWLVKLKPDTPSLPQALLTAAQYDALIAATG